MGTPTERPIGVKALGLGAEGTANDRRISQQEPIKKLFLCVTLTLKKKGGQAINWTTTLTAVSANAIICQAQHRMSQSQAGTNLKHLERCLLNAYFMWPAKANYAQGLHVSCSDTKIANYLHF